MKKYIVLWVLWVIVASCNVCPDTKREDYCVSYTIDWETVLKLNPKMTREAANNYLDINEWELRSAMYDASREKLRELMTKDGFLPNGKQVGHE